MKAVYIYITKLKENKNEASQKARKKERSS